MKKRRHFHNKLILTALLLGWGGMLSGWAAAAEPVNDVRILIDISGSMKHNDPQNLRAPALRLLTGLLPKGSRAGVWTYGQYVNMLVPFGEVNAAWKNQAERASSEINSYGLYTNIEDALQRASKDWREVDDHSQRSLIMLTDGFVDVAKDPALNSAARDRIINNILPRLRDAKVKIYTIALSGEADHALLQQLAAATDGWAEEADNADKLQRIFLHLFEKATRPDTLPLAGNSVRVDNSIEEITFLIFRDPQGKPTQLTDPSRLQFGMENAPKQVHWHRDTGYDLITIAKPQAGEWHILGPEDADNRVMVVTDLKLRATQLPNNLSMEDVPYYFVQLMQQDNVIQRKDFLDLVHITLRQRQEGGQQWEWQLRDDGKGGDIAAGDGTFTHKFDESMKEGRHDLTLLVDGTTFQREQRQVINIYSQPAQASITADPAASGRFVLSVIPYAGLIEPDAMEATATVTDSKGAANEIKLTRSGPAEWRAELNGYADPAGYRAEFHITGNHSGGKPISAQLGPIQFSASGVADVAKVPADQKSESAPAPELQAQADSQKTEAVQAAAPAPEPDPALPPEESHEPSTKPNWYLVGGQILLINILLGGGGYFAYRHWRKAEKHKQGKVKLVEDDPAPGEAEPQASALQEAET